MSPFSLYAAERHLDQRAIVVAVWCVRAYHLSKGRVADVRRWVRGAR